MTERWEDMDRRRQTERAWDVARDRVLDLQADAIDLNRLRRGLCEILDVKLDSVDALLHAVADALDHRCSQ